MTQPKHIRRLVPTVALATGALLFGAMPLPSVPTAMAAGEKITFTFERTDNHGSTVHVGDRLTFKIKYRNNTGGNLTPFPKTSNINDFDVTRFPDRNCRYFNLGPGVTKECGYGFHIVNREDMRNGSFTPTSSWNITHDRAGNDVIETGISVVGEPIAVDPNVPADNAQTPREYAMGAPVELARENYGGFNCHRIPALTKTPINGWLLAAWDGRPNDCQDAPQPNSIVYRISKDGGKSWTSLKVALEGKENPVAEKYGYSDPSFVVDRETNKIFMFTVKSFDRKFQQGLPGVDPNNRGVMHASVVESTDDGQTWTNQRLITASTLKDESTWISRFATSGEGIQLKYGPHAGRLIQQYTTAFPGAVWKAHSVYSDDHGVTWQTGEPTEQGADENKVVELSDGRLMVNSRTGSHHGPGGHHRMYAYSTDQGETWGPWKTAWDLIDPVNNASLIRAFPDAPKNSMRAKILLFSNAKNGAQWQRNNGYVRVSYDDGKNWNEGRQFKDGAMQYSTLTPLGEGKYGLLYEGNSKTINYMTIDNNWLHLEDPGPDAMDPKPELETAKAENQRLTAELAEKTEKVAELTREKEQLESAKSALETERDQLTQDKSRLEGEKATLEREKGELETAKRELESQKSALEEQKTQLTSEKEKLENKKSELEQKVAELEANGQASAAELQRVKGELADVKEKLGTKTNELETANTELAETKAKLAKKEEALTGKTGELENTNAELTKTKQTLGEKEAELATTKQQLANSQSELQKKTAEVDQTKQALANSNEKLAKSQEKLAAKEGELASKKAEYDRNLQELTNQTAKANQKVKSLEAQVADLQEQVKSFENGKSTPELEKAKKELAKATKELQAEQEKSAKLTNDLAVALDKVTKVESKAKENIGQLEKEVAGLNDQVKKLSADKKASASALKAAKDKLAKAQANLATEKANVATLQEQLGAATTELAQSRQTAGKKIATLEKKVENLEEAVKKAEAKGGANAPEVKEAKAKLADAQKELAGEKTKNAKLSDDLNQALDKVAKVEREAQAEVSKLTNKVNQLEDNVAKLKADKNASAAQIKAAQEALSSAKQELNTERVKASGLRTELAKTLTKVSQLEKQSATKVQNLENKVSKINQELAKAKAEGKAGEAKVAKLEQQLTTAQTDLKREKQTNGTLKSKVNQLDKQLRGTPRPAETVQQLLDKIGLRKAKAPKAKKAPFKDVPLTNPFVNEIAWAATGEQKVTTGWPDGTFRPGLPVDRQTMAAFLYRMAGSPKVKVNKVFKDVPVNHQFAKAISWMSQTGITTGWADGTFRPDQPIERHAMAAFMNRACVKTNLCSPALKNLKVDPLLPKFKDMGEGKLFDREVQWMQQAGITTGWADGTFRPENSVTREAMAAFLYRMKFNH
ncbi:hypothetical protein BK816_02265 [Boudabousia tangfeifanii]|uniref:exo-alpha-sialidase n=1 Tax=Boudabousia tangfeifanii TaxID=1912795 RepID=A0A1D9MJ81_9ACTO|nr:S-layer homology domain-containing protein [Boudabousia tangfeifanii]AOZ72268.1 hypothetical protein BK816_02265 [Boudabousia tangfeifanii]